MLIRDDMKKCRSEEMLSDGYELSSARSERIWNTSDSIRADITKQSLLKQFSSWVSLPVSSPRASCARTVASTGGPMPTTTSACWATSTSRPPLEVRRRLRASSSRRSVSRPSSPTRLSESVSVFSSSRTVRRSLPSFPTTVASTLLVSLHRCSARMLGVCLLD